MRKFMASMIAAAMCVQLCASSVLAAGIQTDSNAPQETVTKETETEATEAKGTETEPSAQTEADEVREKTDEAEIALISTRVGS